MLFFGKILFAMIFLKEKEEVEFYEKNDFKPN